MPEYLLFAGDDYYPRGGWEDFQGAFASFGAAELALSGEEGAKWAHVAHDGKIVAAWEREWEDQAWRRLPEEELKWMDNA